MANERKTPTTIPPTFQFGQRPGRHQGGTPGLKRFGPTEKPKDRRGILKKLLTFYLKEGKMIFFVFLLLLGSTAVLLFVPTLVGRAVNAIGLIGNNQDGNNDYSYVTLIGVALLGAYLFDWIFSTLQGWIMAGASQRIVRALRRDLFGKMQKLPLKYLDTHPHGLLMSHITNDIDNVSNTIASSTSQLMNSVITIIGAATFMIILSPQLSLVAFVTLPLILILTKLIASKSRKMFIGQQKELGNLNGTIEEMISGIQMVKAFNQEENVIKQFDEINGDLLYYSTNAQIWAGLLMPFLNVITNLGLALVAGFGGVFVIMGIINVGVIASFITYTRLFIRPINDVASTFNMIQSALAGAERVFNVLDEVEEKPDSDNALELTNPLGEVEFKNVCFEYDKDVRVLKDVSFKVAAGETVALVGATGAGKTTIVNLLSRFYDATSGEVYIDGHNITDYKRESLRNAFTVVLQDTCMFTGSIAENISYSKPGATREEIVEAAVAANADHFIRRLPDGYNTMISGEISTLSQGERQLLAISRAILNFAPILILDEATSSVDTSTELKIQEALLKFRAGRTSFIIAHRISTIKDADRIMIVEGGKIVETGTHEELIAKNGIYAQMHNSQFDIDES
jgi:ATP-binding cassette subfamily B protein